MLLNHSIPLICRLNQQKEHLIEFFQLPEVEDDKVWENDRNKFLKSIEKKK